MSGDFKFDFSNRKPKGKRVKPVPENLDENAKEYRCLLYTSDAADEL